MQNTMGTRAVDVGPPYVVGSFYILNRRESARLTGTELGVGYRPKLIQVTEFEPRDHCSVKYIQWPGGKETSDMEGPHFTPLWYDRVLGLRATEIHLFKEEVDGSKPSNLGVGAVLMEEDTNRVFFIGPKTTQTHVHILADWPVHRMAFWWWAPLLYPGETAFERKVEKDAFGDLLSDV